MINFPKRHGKEYTFYCQKPASKRAEVIQMHCHKMLHICPIGNLPIFHIALIDLAASHCDLHKGLHFNFSQLPLCLIEALWRRTALLFIARIFTESCPTAIASHRFEWYFLTVTATKCCILLAHDAVFNSSLVFWNSKEEPSSRL